MKPTLRSMLLVGVATLGLSGIAHAQEGSGAAEAESPAADEIIVTAQRREESLQKTALAVAVVSANDLNKAGVTDVTGLTKLVPSLIVQPATGSSVGFYLRGVGSLVGNAFTENPVAFNYNQVYIARPAALMGTFYDLERVEVLKGPQGTLYGRNATGGAINVIPRRPKLGEFGGSVNLEYGNYNAMRAQAAINLPMGENAAFRLAGQIADRDGYLSDGYDDEEGQALRGSFRLEQGALSATLVADYFHQGGKGAGGVLVPSPLAPNAPAVSERIGNSDPRSTSALLGAILGNPFLPPPFKIVAPGLNGIGLAGNDGFIDSDFWGISGNIDIDLDFATLTVVPAYRDSRPDYLTYNGGYYGRVIEKAKQKSLEVRLSSNGDGPLKYVIGGYYFDEDQSSFNHFVQGQVLSTKFAVDLDNRSNALFGQATYELVPDFRLLAGVRYSHERKKADIALTQTGIFAGAPVDPFNNTVAPVNVSGAKTFEKVTWKGGFEWDVAPNNLLYANIATGFKSGGFFIATLDNSFAPEKITAYTVGSKNSFFGNRLKLNFEGFYWDYNDQQINYIGPTRNLNAMGNPVTGSGLVTTNAGKSRIYGAEVELSAQVIRNGTFMANVQYLNGRYTDFTFTALGASAPRTTCPTSVNPAFPAPPGQTAFVVNCSGKSQINTPEWSATLGYEHVVPVGEMDLVLGARTKIESSRFLAIDYLPEERQGSYMTSDLYVTLKGGTGSKWSVTGFVNNLEDETIYAGTSLRPVYPVVFNILRAPRTYGIRAGFEF